MQDLTNFPPFTQSDLFGYDAAGQLRLLVEVKARVQSGATRKGMYWLRQVGESMPLRFALFVTSDLFMLRLPAHRRLVTCQFVGGIPEATKAQFFLQEVQSAADYVIDVRPCLDVAIDTQRVPLHMLEEDGLVQVVASWLNFCTATAASDLQRQSANAWLVESGLHEVMYQGSVGFAPRATEYAFTR